jgi:hypothetical protein
MRSAFAFTRVTCELAMRYWGADTIALAGLFPDGPQALLAIDAMLFFFRQVMHDPLAQEILRERLPAAGSLLRNCISGSAGGIVIRIVALHW